MNKENNNVDDKAIGDSSKELPKTQLVQDPPRENAQYAGLLVGSVAR